MTDPLKTIGEQEQEALDRLIGPSTLKTIEETQRAIDRLAGPSTLKTIEQEQKAIDRLIGPSVHEFKLAKIMLDACTDYSSQAFGAMLDAQRSVTDLSSQLLTATQGIQNIPYDFVGDALAEQRRIEMILHQAAAPSYVFRLIEEAQRSIADVSSQLLATTRGIDSLFTRLLSDTLLEQRRMSSAVTEFIADLQQLFSSDIYDALNQLPDTGEDSTEEDLAALEATIQRPRFLALPIIGKIKELIAFAAKHPSTKAFIRWLVRFLVEFTLVTLLTSAINPPQVVRELRTIVPADLSDLRVVAKKELDATQTDRKDSAKVGTLYLGDVVRLIEKRSKRCHVEWQVSGKPVSGWVMSKYLEPLSQ